MKSFNEMSNDEQNEITNKCCEAIDEIISIGDDVGLFFIVHGNIPNSLYSRSNIPKDKLIALLRRAADQFEQEQIALKGGLH